MSSGSVTPGLWNRIQAHVKRQNWRNKRSSAAAEPSQPSTLIRTRRRLYRTGLPPSTAIELLTLIDDMHQSLTSGRPYASWSAEQRIGFIIQAVETIGRIQRFQPEAEPDVWQSQLRWWLRRLRCRATNPEKNRQLAQERLTMVHLPFLLGAWQRHWRVVRRASRRATSRNIAGRVGANGSPLDRLLAEGTALLGNSRSSRSFLLGRGLGEIKARSRVRGNRVLSSAFGSCRRPLRPSPSVTGPRLHMHRNCTTSESPQTRRLTVDIVATPR